MACNGAGGRVGVEIKAYRAGPLMRDVRRFKNMDTRRLFEATPCDLAVILDACQWMDLAALQIPSKEATFIMLAASRMARLVSEVGHNGSLLHQSITDFLIDLTRNMDVRVALIGTYALAEHGAIPRRVVERLETLAASERRPDDYADVTLRAIALRMLRRLDPAVATKLLGTPAFEEFAHAVEHWLRTDASKNPDVLRELCAESEWLTATTKRRTRR